jgi:flagellar basal body-associated protein FliL
MNRSDILLWVAVVFFAAVTALYIFFDLSAVEERARATDFKHVGK